MTASIWQWMLSYIRQVKGVYAAAVALLVVSVITNIGITYSQKLIIDDIFVGRHYDRFPYLLLLFVAVVLAYIGSWCFKDIMFERASDRIRLLMRRDYMEHLHAMPMGRLQQERTGSLVSYLNAYITSKNVYIWNLDDLLDRLISLSLLLVIVGFVLPQLLLILVPLGLLYIVQGRYFGSRMRPLSQDTNDALAAHGTAIEEGIASTREVIAFHQVEWERKKLSGTFNRYLQSVLRGGRTERKQLAVSEPLRWGANLAILGFGGYQVIRGELSIGMFVVLYQFGVQIIDAIHGAYQSVLAFSGAYGGMVKAQALIEGERISRPTAALTAPLGDITIEGLTFAYDSDCERRPVLRELSLDIPAGEKIAIVGDSGSGKSTIAQLLVRFYEPDHGAIFAGDKRLSEISRQNWADQVAVVFQDPYLFPDTIRNNLLMGRTYSEGDMHEACRMAEIHDFIESLPKGYDTLLGERGVTLSGGQRQRIALARALLGDPELLILDEASSALDPLTERLVHRNMDAARAGRTTVFIAHRLTTIENADRIYVMADGAVADAGTHEELMGKGGRYAELYRASAV